MFICNKIVRNMQGRCQRGGQWRPAPLFEIGAPPFNVWPRGCCILPMLYFKIVPLLLVFTLPLQLYPGDRPENMHLFLKKVAVKTSIYAQAL